MKQKILIGSIFAALVLLSMPFVSTLQAAPAPLNSLGFIEVCVKTQTPTGLIGVPGLTATLKNNNQIVRIGTTNIAGRATFFGLEQSNGYTITFTASLIGSTKPLKVEWNSGNFFRLENLDFTENYSNSISLEVLRPYVA